MKQDYLNGTDARVQMSEDELNRVTGGVSSDDPMMYGRCPRCGRLLIRHEKGYFCTDCNVVFDENREPVKG